VIGIPDEDRGQIVEARVVCPAVEAMNTMRPNPRSRIGFSAGFTDTKAPVRFT
jgi:hypothetical protein